MAYKSKSGRNKKTMWDDLRVPITATKAEGAKAPTFAKILDNGSGSQGVYAMLFDDTAEEELFFEVQIPHAWKQGTSIHAHVHWMPTANGAVDERVSWGLEYAVCKIGVVFPNTSIAYGNTSIFDETLVAKKHYLTSIVEIDMSAIDGVSSMLACRIFRDATGAGATDNYPHDAALLEFDFHYEIDSLGSRTEYLK